MTAALSHQTVLLREAVEALTIKPAGIYVDGTFGSNGNAYANFNLSCSSWNTAAEALTLPSRKAALTPSS